MNVKIMEDEVYNMLTLSTLTYKEILKVLDGVKARVGAMPKVKFSPSKCLAIDPDPAFHEQLLKNTPPVKPKE